MTSTITSIPFQILDDGEDHPQRMAGMGKMMNSAYWPVTMFWSGE